MFSRDIFIEFSGVEWSLEMALYVDDLGLVIVMLLMNEKMIMILAMIQIVIVNIIAMKIDMVHYKSKGIALQKEVLPSSINIIMLFTAEAHLNK